MYPFFKREDQPLPRPHRLKLGQLYSIKEHLCNPFCPEVYLEFSTINGFPCSGFSQLDSNRRESTSWYYIKPDIVFVLLGSRIRFIWYMLMDYVNIRRLSIHSIKKVSFSVPEIMGLLPSVADERKQQQPKVPLQRNDVN